MYQTIFSPCSLLLFPGRLGRLLLLLLLLLDGLDELLRLLLLLLRRLVLLLGLRLPAVVLEPEEGQKRNDINYPATVLPSRSLALQVIMQSDCACCREKYLISES